ncbi:CHASE2 domain-containing protein [Myxosarcina sp. GI1]|uniref:CHASE2 domain-containing protein n=1 Tax=Myxosarcina sp. GI1 TaxID=1541065 RepID=UPI00056A56D5|nr:CHASE2 domain-containing protein [Myxosarcina sp. GI1]
MNKLVVLKLGEETLKTGFPVTLQIGEEYTRPSVEITGNLPAYPEIIYHYRYWQTIYRNLKLASRPIGLPKQTLAANTIEECQQAANIFNTHFNNWLAADSFRPIREKFLEKLSPEDSIRILLQTEDFQIQQLPWQLWDLLEQYPKAEIALSSSVYEQADRKAYIGEKIKILAILGNSQGIDTKTDRAILERLPNVDITFLVEPERQEINDRFWEQHWQILFFAGHSSTQELKNAGKIYINQTESLTITQLKYALKKAVARGLQLAIFNSCDGLGLAREFAPLQIPQIIVMREPVPDKVAHQFSKYFLQAYSQGTSCYLAVREARERLQGVESQYPCASWLPVICQNPAEVPLIWQELYNSKPILNSTQVLVKFTPNKKKINLFSFSAILIVSTLMFGLVMGTRYFGFLQSLELKAFDRLLQLRPSEKPDPRLLIVAITEEDVRNQQSEKPRGSLSDKSLARLLTQLEQARPAVIGLDIYRDYPVDEEDSELDKLLKNSSSLVSVCKVSNPRAGISGVAPPPEVSKNNLGFSNILLDSDNVVRRHYLALTPLASVCNTSYSLSVQLALRYLYNQGIELKFTSEGAWQLGKLTFKPLESHTGGYQGIDALGHQILLNYRASPSLEAIAPQISLGDFLAGKLNDSAIKDRIVLIGTTAESFRDYSLTPYTDNGKPKIIPGVVLQAQMVSQLINAAMDRRPLLQTWSIWYEIFWIWSWSLIGSLLAWYLRQPNYLIIGVGGVLLILSGASLILLIIFALWIPLVPAFLAVSGSAICTAVFLANSKNPKLS